MLYPACRISIIGDLWVGAVDEPSAKHCTLVHYDLVLGKTRTFD